MKIGSVANKADLSIDTLRFYEREGLISSPRRLFSGYRDYPEDVLGRLEFIKEAKGLGFSLREIKELLSMGVKSTRECGPVTQRRSRSSRRWNRKSRGCSGCVARCERWSRNATDDVCSPRMAAAQKRTIH